MLLDTGRQSVYMENQTIQEPSVKEEKRKKAREMPIHRQDFQLLQPLVKMNMVLLGDQVIGIPIALTVLQRVRGTIQAWMASAHLDLAHHSTHVVLDLGCSRSFGSRKTIRRFQKICVVLWYYDRILSLQ